MDKLFSVKGENGMSQKAVVANLSSIP